LGDKSVILLRAHGFAVVGPSVEAAVFRAIYTEINARVQAQAAALGGEMEALGEEEGRLADAMNLITIGRSWNYGKESHHVGQRSWSEVKVGQRSWVRGQR
jgi:HCOMODA/2-hydroxy-3-carboxy-muconic semialdehyde decarboxylase